MQTENAELAGLRQELDRIDDGLHDLLMQRAAIVQRVAARKAGLGAPGQWRPGREASILRRLLGRHAGPLPPAALVRIWRELLAAMVGLQGPFAVAVAPGSAAAARAQFGAHTTLCVHDRPEDALAALHDGRAAVAVLPAPESRPVAPWWPSLLDEPRLHVVARLPFWQQPPHAAQAWAIATAAPDPSGDDRGLLALELAHEAALATLPARLTEAGFAGKVILRHVSRGAVLALADVAGFVAGDDPRMARLRALGAAPVVLGAYACPIVADPAHGAC